MTERVGGIKTVIEYARKFGITSPLLPYLPVALGAADITLAEQTAAFTTFPNDGVRVVPRYIRKVTDYDGRVLEDNYPEVSDVVSARTARIMVTMLREVVLHGTGFAGQQAESSAGRQDRYDQRFHRRMVRRLLAVDHLRRVGGLRREEDAGQQRDRRGRRAADLDGLHAGGVARDASRKTSPHLRRRRRARWRKRLTRPTANPATARRTDATLLAFVLRALILIVVFLASLLIAMRFAIHGRQTTVPKIVGMAQSQAERLLGDHGLVLDEADRFFSADVPPGRVMSQVPRGGMSRCGAAGMCAWPRAWARSAWSFRI